MSEPKFTPGPWRIVRYCEDIEIANVADLLHFYRRETVEANAALIAAAPELYRELEELASLVQNSDSTYWEGVNPDEVVETALAALTKARGE